MNKRGVLRDTVLWVVLIFVISIVLLLVYLLLDGLNTAVQDNDLMTQDIKDFTLEYRNDFSAVWDYTFLTVVVSVMLGLLILTWFLKSNPMLFFALMLFMVVLMVFSAYLSNAFETIIGDTTLAAVAANFTIMSFVMQNFFGFVVVQGFLMLIVFFAKPGGTL